MAKASPRFLGKRDNEPMETLKEYRLDVPQVTLLAHELHKAGVDIPEGILTTEELVNALCL